MNLTAQLIETIPIHFILCTERTGSSLLSLSLNLSPHILSSSEEPFVIYFYKKYKDKKIWTSEEIINYVEEFWWMSEKNLDLFYSSKKTLIDALEPFKANLNYQLLIRITYFQFIEPKSKDSIKCIIDKQIKFFFYLPLLCQILPDAKFCVLVRDVRDNVISKSNHQLNSSGNPIYLSALWNFTYSNVYYLKLSKREYMVLKYEDFAAQPEIELNKICDFFEVPYYKGIIETEGKYQQFLELRKEKVDPEHIKYLGTFQKSLYKGITSKKIGVYKNSLPKKTESKIIKINKELFDLFGYKIDKKEEKKLNITDYWQIFKAYMYRPFLLKLYYYVPFSLKLTIKKLRK